MFLSRLLALLLLPLACMAAALEHDVEVNIAEEVEVRGETVRLGDIGQVYVRNIQQFKSLSELVLAQFPADQNEITLPGSYIKQRIQELSGSSLKVEVAEIVRFRRGESAVKVGAPASLTEEIKTLAEKLHKIPEGTEIQVEIERAPEIPAGTRYVLEPTMEQPSWRGSVTFKLVPAIGPAQWIGAKIRVFGERWVAKRNLRFQEELKPEHFERARIELTSVKGSDLALDDLSQILDKTRAKRTISAHAVLTQEMLDRRPDLKSGQRVRVVFQSDSGLRVEADAMTIQDATIGSEAKAKLSRSKKMVVGTLVSPGVIEVNL